MNPILAQEMEEGKTNDKRQRQQHAGRQQTPRRGRFGFDVRRRAVGRTKGIVCRNVV